MIHSRSIDRKPRGILLYIYIKQPIFDTRLPLLSSYDDFGEFGIVYPWYQPQGWIALLVGNSCSIISRQMIPGRLRFARRSFRYPKPPID